MYGNWIHSREITAPAYQMYTLNKFCQHCLNTYIVMVHATAEHVGFCCLFTIHYVCYIIYLQRYFNEMSLKVHWTHSPKSSKKHMHSLIFQVSVKIQFDRLQTTYLLTEQRKIWYQPKHRMQLKPKKYSNQLHGALPTCEYSMHKICCLCATFTAGHSPGH